ncbi:3-hydroxybutyryl-CoA dehydrogenase [Thiofilum flexile]|uniref:3-hydroxybutyryl-CoA dehydrogenase n=1 Tax=Thiofilum flexile TaxID=125627 RepID=UPI000382352A|nr:3-hydroxybutyryl-CoA dehydrogenase [Thiofilum flexile]
MSIKTIGVIGSGTMGNGIAQVFAMYGFKVVLNDLNETIINRGLKTIDTGLERLIKKESITTDQKSSILANIKPTTELKALADVDIVVEAASERLEIKADLFRRLDSICKPSTLLASNTSSISLTRIARETKRPDKVIGMHFMNPVPIMNLVEIIRALQTSEMTYQIVTDLAKSIEKTPVTVNDSVGFVSNRILMPMINEAIYTLYEGVATAEAIDEIMKLGMGHPMGPLTLADLIGLDTCLTIMEILHEGFGHGKYNPCPLLRRMVDAGYLGRKTGRGFYVYEQK